MGIISRVCVVALASGLFVLFSSGKPIHAGVPRPPASFTQSTSPTGVEPALDGRAVTCGSSTSTTVVMLDFAILADYSAFYTEVGAYDRVLQIFNYVQATYIANVFAKPVSFRLHRIYQFVGSDPFSTSTDPNTFITSIRNWKLANAADNSVALVALTARTMDMGDFGEGFTGSLCSSFNVGFVSEAGSSLNVAGAYTGHVIGHLGGMTHDNNPPACPTTGYLMAATPVPPMSGLIPISSCSISSWNAYANTITCVHQWGPALGDLNCDCAVNMSDIDALVLALLDPVAYQAAFPACSLTQCDLNGDGVVDGKDIRCLKSILLQ